MAEAKERKLKGSLSEQDEQRAAEENGEQQLEMDAGKPETPKPVRGRKLLAEFVRPIFDRTTQGAPLIAFEFSFPLTPDHETKLPAEIEAAWKIVKRGHCKRYDLLPDEVPPQTVELWLVPDDKEADIKIVGGKIVKPSLQVVEQDGAGKTKKVIRLSLRVETERETAYTKFATTYDTESIWIVLKETQGSLLKEKET
jgi:hypothetical protein